MYYLRVFGKIGSGSIGLANIGGLLNSGPIVDSIILIPLGTGEILEELSQIPVVRFVSKLQILSIIQILSKLLGMALAEDIDRGAHFLVLNHAIFGLGILTLHVLPGQNASQKVHKHIAN